MSISNTEKGPHVIQREREREGDGERSFYNIDTERESKSFYHGYGLYVCCNYCSSIACSIVATPGRFLHLLVEMDMKLVHVEYVVFDEADRLFEMGFSDQLHEIIHRLPEQR